MTEDDKDLTFEILLPPLQKLGLGGFVWCSALAWICTRNQEFTTSFHRDLIGSAPTWSEAIAMLRMRVGGFSMRILTTVDEATDQLKGSVEKQAVEVKLNPGGSASSPAWLDWLEHDFSSDSLRHDQIAPLGENFEPLELLNDIRFNEQQILARWRIPGLIRRVGPDWSLNETAYWACHRNHVGYVHNHNSCTRDSVARIRQQLIAGKLHCHPFEGADCAPDFWKGHSLQESNDESLIFSCLEVQKCWPMMLPQELVQGAGKGEATHILQAAGLGKNRAEMIAGKYVPEAVRGPKRQPPGQ